MAMKRLREEEEDSSCEEDLDSKRTADFLMLLSRGDGDGQEAVELQARPAPLPGRVFECKTCNRQFASFQALGGHRASHKKPRMVEDHKHESPAKAKVHECSICGLEFAIGQALGGHMRRHRIINTVEGFPVVKKSISSGNKKVFLDLNMPPSETEQPELGFGIGLAPMMSFVH